MMGCVTLPEHCAAQVRGGDTALNLIVRAAAALSALSSSPSTPGFTFSRKGTAQLPCVVILNPIRRHSTIKYLYEFLCV